MKWLIQRLLAVTVLSLLIFLASHLIIRLIPGDPVDVIMAETGTSIPREVLVRDLQLDRPWWDAFSSQVRGLFAGDLGQSIHYKGPIAPILNVRAKNSLRLMAFALLIGISIALLLALARSWDHRFRKPLGAFVDAYSLLLAAAPAAWVAPLLALLFCVKLRLFPVTGSLTLCALVLGLTLSGFWTRAFSRMIANERTRDHYRSAEARGIPQGKLLLKYALFPASGSLIAYLGTQAGWLAAGAVITETVFEWPGLGSLLVESILKRDYPLMEMTIFLTSLLIFLGNGLGDALQLVVHPRLREEELR